jgi:hypothetical protein
MREQDTKGGKDEGFLSEPFQRSTDFRPELQNPYEAKSRVGRGRHQGTKFFAMDNQMPVKHGRVGFALYVNCLI